MWFDLLRTQTFLALTRQPESFRQQVEARPKGSWVVVDEVQRLPSLWRTPSGSEVDFVWTRGPHAVGLEVKAATMWRNEYGAPLKALIAQGNLQAGYGVYMGAAELKDGPLRVFPLKRFLKELASGHVLMAGREK